MSDPRNREVNDSLVEQLWLHVSDTLLNNAESIPGQ